MTYRASADLVIESQDILVVFKYHFCVAHSLHMLHYHSVLHSIQNNIVHNYTIGHIQMGMTNLHTELPREVFFKKWF